MSIPVQIRNRAVTCPHCRHMFAVRRKEGGTGAAYVEEWSRLTEQCIKILVVWVSQTDMLHRQFEKKALRQKLADNRLYINEGPFNARISELLGLNLLKTTGYESPGRSHMTKKAPEYMLNENRVFKILNQGGRL